MKPMDTFDCDSTPELDVRLIKELADGQYVRQARVERNIGYYTVSEFS